MMVFFARDSNQTFALRLLLARELTCLADCLTFFSRPFSQMASRRTFDASSRGRYLPVASSFFNTLRAWSTLVKDAGSARKAGRLTGLNGHTHCSKVERNGHDSWQLSRGDESTGYRR
jgi:hypothetical protein